MSLDTAKNCLEKIEHLLKQSSLDQHSVGRIIKNLSKDKISVDARELLEIALQNEGRLFHLIVFEYYEIRNVDKQKVVSVLSELYEKLVFDVLPTQNVMMIIELYLLQRHYTRDVNGGTAETKRTQIPDEKRLEIISKCVDIILNTAKLGEYYQCDDRFLFLLRTISMHLFLMPPKQKNKFREKFPVENMEYCLNIFYLIHKKTFWYKTYKLAINKPQILIMLEKFHQSLLKHSKNSDQALLESYYEVTEMEKNKEDYKNRVELFWQLKMAAYPTDICLDELMGRLNDLLEFKVLPEKEVVAIRNKIQKKLEQFRRGNVSKIQHDIQNAKGKVQATYKTMLEVYYDASRRSPPKNEMVSFIQVAHELQETQSPFEEFAAKLNFLLSSNVISEEDKAGMKARALTKSQEQSARASWGHEVSFDDFQMELEEVTLAIKNSIAIFQILQNISVVDDMHELDSTMGPLIIRRALHVIGEYIKNTNKTKNISEELQIYLSKLNHCLQLDKAMKVRDQLSHNHSFYRIEHMEKMSISDYKELQEDLRNLNYMFKSILCIHNRKIIDLFYRTVSKCSAEMQLGSLLVYVQDVKGIKLAEFETNPHILSVINDLQVKILPALSALDFKDDNEKKQKLESYIMVLSSIVDNVNEKGGRYYYNHYFDDLKTLMRHQTLEKVRQHAEQYLAEISIVHPRLVLGFTEYIAMLHNLFTDVTRLISGLPEYHSLASAIQQLRLTIFTKFQVLINIDIMNETLDDDKSNPALELACQKYLNQIHWKVGVRQDALKTHPNYENARTALIDCLKDTMSIFDVDEKFVALENYFRCLEQNIATKLQEVKRQEQRLVQGVLTSKLSDIMILQANDASSKMAQSMLLLETLDILNVKNLKDNLHQLNEVAPLLCGRNLRNYLGHGNIAYEVLTFAGAHSMPRIININARVIGSLLPQFELCANPDDSSTSYGKQNERGAVQKEISYKNQNFEEQLRHFQLQDEICRAVTQLSLPEFWAAMRNGASPSRRTHAGRTLYDLFQDEHSSLYMQYKQSNDALRPEQREFIDEFLKVIPLQYQEKYANEAIAIRKKEQYNNSLFFACQSGCARTVALICENEKNLDLYAEDVNGMTPLMYACRYSHHDIITILLEKLPSVELNSLFCDALAFSNDLRVFEMIIPKCKDINTLDDNGEEHTLLNFVLLANCDIEIIDYLIAQGVNTTRPDARGRSVTHYVVMCNRLKSFNNLIQRGFDFTQQMANRETPFKLACARGYMDILRVLLNYEYETAEWKACLASAILHNLSDVATLLFDKYADQLNSDDLFNLLQFAFFKKNRELTAFFFRNIQIASGWHMYGFLLLAMDTGDHQIFDIIQKHAEKCNKESLRQAVIDHPDLLHAAVRHHPDILIKLAELGADCSGNNRMQPGNRTLLHTLLQMPGSCLATLKFLVEKFEPDEINARDDFGRTALYLAVHARKIHLANWLLKCGADTTLTTEEGRTLLHAACMAGSLEMLDLLAMFGIIEQIRMKDIHDKTPLEYAGAEMAEIVKGYKVGMDLWMIFEVSLCLYIKCGSINVLE